MKIELECPDRKTGLALLQVIRQKATEMTYPVGEMTVRYQILVFETTEGDVYIRWLLKEDG